MHSRSKRFASTLCKITTASFLEFSRDVIKRRDIAVGNLSPLQRHNHYLNAQ